MIGESVIKDNFSNLRDWKHKGDYHTAVVTRTRTYTEPHFILFTKKVVEVADIEIFAQGSYDRHELLLDWREQATGKIIEATMCGDMGDLVEQYRFRNGVQREVGVEE